MSKKISIFFQNDILYAIKTVAWLGMKQLSYKNMSYIHNCSDSSFHLRQVRRQWKSACASVIYWRSTYYAIHKASIIIGERGSYILGSS